MIKKVLRALVLFLFGSTAFAQSTTLVDSGCGITHEAVSSADLICSGSFVKPVLGPFFQVEKVEGGKWFIGDFKLDQPLDSGRLSSIEVASFVRDVDVPFPWNRRLLLILKRDEKNNRYVLVDRCNSWLAVTDDGGGLGAPVHRIEIIKGFVKAALSVPSDFEFNQEQCDQMKRYLSDRADFFFGGGAACKSAQVSGYLSGSANLLKELKNERILTVEQAVCTVINLELRDETIDGLLAKLSKFPDKDIAFDVLMARARVGSKDVRSAAFQEAINSWKSANSEWKSKLQKLFQVCADQAAKEGDLVEIKSLLNSEIPEARRTAAFGLRGAKPSVGVLAFWTTALTDSDIVMQHQAILALYDMAKKLGFKAKKETPVCPGTSHFAEDPVRWIGQWKAWLDANRKTLLLRIGREAEKSRYGDRLW